MTPNQRAYELLRWQALAPLADYDESIDYFAIWKQASDKALNKFDNSHEQKTRRDQTKASASPARPSSSCGAPDHDRERAGLAPTDEKPGIRPRHSRGRKRC